MKMAGVKALNPFPQCTSVASLCAHIDAWEDLFTEFGAGLDNAPDKLVIVFFKEKLPASIITDLLDHPDVSSYNDIMQSCRRRTNHRKENDLCETTKRRFLARTRIHSMPVTEQSGSDPLGVQPRVSADKPSSSTRLYAQATCRT